MNVYMAFIHGGHRIKNLRMSYLGSGASHGVDFRGGLTTPHRRSQPPPQAHLSPPPPVLETAPRLLLLLLLLLLRLQHKPRRVLLPHYLQHLEVALAAAGTRSKEGLCSAPTAVPTDVLHRQSKLGCYVVSLAGRFFLPPPPARPHPTERHHRHLCFCHFD